MNEEYKQCLMKAYVDLICWGWADVVGDKPDGFDSMDQDQKYKVLLPKVKWVEDKIGSDMCSWAWWKYELNRTYDEWLEWYHSAKRLSLERTQP